MKPRKCHVIDCARPSYCRGWCVAHYARWRKHGNVEHGGVVVEHLTKAARELTCTVAGCGRPTESRNLCTTHYHRWKRHRDVNVGRVVRSSIERFMTFVEPRADGCWQWIGALDRKGYGHFTDPRRVSAHRWSYTHHRGPIPDGLEIDHLCRNTGCVNPEHLEAVTRDENLRREHAVRHAVG